MTAEPTRRDGWIVTYDVEVVFDTDYGRTRYDHVGTLARCTTCGERLDLRGSPTALERHARTHERRLSVDGGDPRPVEGDAYTPMTMADFSADDAKEVTTRG